MNYECTENKNALWMSRGRFQTNQPKLEGDFDISTEDPFIA
jgi:hypothetical protein